MANGMLALVFVALIAVNTVVAFIHPVLNKPTWRIARLRSTKGGIEKDDKGYIIKPRDWFNGLSKDPGASLTDPRAVPAECKEFAERIKSGGQTTMKETIEMIDNYYNYFEVNWERLLIFSQSNDVWVCPVPRAPGTRFQNTLHLK